MLTIYPNTIHIYILYWYRLGRAGKNMSCDIIQQGSSINVQRTPPVIDVKFLEWHGFQVLLPRRNM